MIGNGVGDTDTRTEIGRKEAEGRVLALDLRRRDGVGRRGF